MENNENKKKVGSIYVLKSKYADKVFVGSSINNILAKRLFQHKKAFKENKKYDSSFEILKNDEVCIESVKKINFTTKTELKSEEEKYIKELGDKCVNNINYLGKNNNTKREEFYCNHPNYNREYYLKNKEHMINLKKNKECGKIEEIKTKRKKEIIRKLNSKELKRIPHTKINNYGIKYDNLTHLYY